MQIILKYNFENRLRVSYTKLLQGLFQRYTFILELWQFALHNSMVFLSHLIPFPLVRVCDVLISSKYVWEDFNTTPLSETESVSTLK